MKRAHLRTRFVSFDKRVPPCNCPPSGAVTHFPHPRPFPLAPSRWPPCTLLPQVAVHLLSITTESECSRTPYKWSHAVSFDFCPFYGEVDQHFISFCYSQFCIFSLHKIWQFGYAGSGPAAAPRLWISQEALPLHAHPVCVHILLHAHPVCASEFIYLSTLFPLPGMLFPPHLHGSSVAVWVECLLLSVFFRNFLCPRKCLAYRSC